MMFLQYFLSNLILIPTALMCVLPMKNQLRMGLRKTLLFGLPVITAIAAATSWAQAVFNMNSNELLAPVLLACYLLYDLNVRTAVWKKLGVFSIALSLLSIMSNLASCIDSLRGLSYLDQGDSLRSSAFYLLLGCVFVLPLINYFSRYGSRVLDQPMPSRVWVVFTVLSLIIFGINMSFRPALETAYGDQTLTLWLMAAFFLLLALWYMLLAAFYIIIWDLKTSAEMRERNRLFEMQTYQFDSQQRFIKASERTRHDFRQSIRTLNALYDAGDYEALGSYLHQYAAELPVKEFTSYTENAVLNALLNFYAHVARQNEIEFNVRVNLPEGLPINDVELCGMVGNILENAVVACKDVEARKISLSILAERGEQLYIVATNTFDGRVRKKDGVYLSTNRGGEGIGLASIAASAGKYGGVAQFYHEGNQFYSNIAIPLNQQEEEEEA